LYHLLTFLLFSSLGTNSTILYTQMLRAVIRGFANTGYNVIIEPTIRSSSSAVGKYASQFQPIPEEDNTKSMFEVTIKNGFLPRRAPLPELPSKYRELENLLQRMPIQTKDGEKGLLATGDFGAALENELPLYDVSQETDIHVLSALFRDYTFALSAYLLEPCDLNYKKTFKYGRGREKVPKNLAIPITKVARSLSMRPFMEYATCYALNNYKVKNNSLPLTVDNMELVRSFSGMRSEFGFILTHIAMVRFSPNMVKYTLDVLDACRQQDREAFNRAMIGFNDTLSLINAEMEIMWSVSRPNDYAQFRTFIMGTKDQIEMFPDGIVYEGVSPQGQYYRGESGANDNIIPTVDNLLELTEEMPVNALTEILREFRSYRPPKHTEWLTFVEKSAKEVGIRKFAIQDPVSTMLYMQVLDQNRDFRNRHWNLTKEYIIKLTQHPRATGGSPILSWLPNQLSVVLKSMVEVGTEAQKEHANSSEETQTVILELLHRAKVQARFLEREVMTLKIGSPRAAYA
jgi:indoleamine 2,3-dioxygenase